jgi:uncharacterized protein YndB with AHSA1/START domain
VQVEVEVPGTPEQVWQAIATGPGISSWFVPARLDPKVGGKIVMDFGPGMESTSTVTAYDAPRKFTAESSEGMAPGAPPMATEWTVEARAGGTCIVRVVHSLFASNDDWDNQLESVEGGWPTFFAVLRLYLAHHAGEPSALVQAMAMAQGSADDAWATLSGALGFASAKTGQRIRAGAPGAPAFAGTLERMTHSPHGNGVVVHLDAPIAGVAIVGTYPCGGPTMAMISLYLYGKRAAEIAQRDDAAWKAWIGNLFTVKT